MNWFRSNRHSKIYSQRSYSIPISNDRSHEGLSHNHIVQQKHVQERKQIQKMMHGIIKQRMFGNFIKDQTRVSDQNYKQLDSLCKKTMNGRIQSNTSHRIRSISKKSTIQHDQSIRNRRHTMFGLTKGKQMHTIETSKMLSQYDIPFVKNMSRTSTYRSKGLDPKKNKRNLGLKQQIQKAFATMPMERTLTRDFKAEKIIPLYHQKKLQLNQKSFIQFYRKLAGISPNQIIYQFKLSRQMIYNRYKLQIDPKIIQRFFNFFGFPNSFGIRQYMQLIQNAANANLRFIYFWVFVLLDQNGNGVLTHQDFFKIINSFKQNQYIQKQVYMLVKFLSLHKNRVLEGQQLFEETLTANHNLRLEELQQLMKQTQKDRIDVNCVKNTTYRQTLLSLEHSFHERQKLTQLEDTQAETKALKIQMIQKKKKLQDKERLRLRDFYVIFGNKRPKIFCYILKLLANIQPDEYQ